MWPRFGAKLIDWLVLVIPVFFISAVVGGNGSGALNATGGREVVAGIISTLVTYGYFVWMETARGQTVGKMALNFKVIGPDGGLPSQDVALRRNAGTCCSGSFPCWAGCCSSWSSW